jgi:glycosidase
LPDFFLKKLRKSVKEEDPNAIIIGEVWEDASNKIAYSQRREYLQGYELDSVMNYPLKDAIIAYMQTGKAADLLHCIRALLNHYPKQTIDCLMNILGTHDTARILTVLGGIYCNNKEEMASKKAYLSETDKHNAIEKLKIAAVLQYTLPGVPCLYYGDENAMEGHIDPFCRRCFDWEHLNEDLIGFYSKLGEIREKYRNIFKDGEFEDVIVEESFICYKRTKNNESIYIYANNSSSIYQLNLNGNYFDCLKNEKLEEKITVKAYSFGILVKNSF